MVLVVGGEISNHPIWWEEPETSPPTTMGMGRPVPTTYPAPIWRQYESRRAVKLPWIFPGPPLTFNGAPGNIQVNFYMYDQGVLPGGISAATALVTHGPGWPLRDANGIAQGDHFHLHLLLKLGLLRGRKWCLWVGIMPTLSWYQHCRHWWHHRLSWRQPAVPPVKTSWHHEDSLFQCYMYG